MEAGLGKNVGQLKRFIKADHDREVPLPLPMSHWYLSPEPLEMPPLPALSPGRALSPLSPLLTGTHTLKSLGIVHCHGAHLQSQKQKQTLFFGAFQNSSESGWCVLTTAFLPQAAPSSAHQPGHRVECALPWALLFFSSLMATVVYLVCASTISPKRG